MQFVDEAFMEDLIEGLGKVLLHSNIMSHFEKHAVLTEAQHGFRSRRSCESQLIYTVHELTKGLSEGKQIFQLQIW
jgi:hypothetical protein